MKTGWLLAVVLLACVRGAPPSEWVPPTRESSVPLVIAHRGASGHLPEHTLAAYEHAVALGADYIEPDLVSTRDGHLIARHEGDLGATTNVGEVFPERATSRLIDGVRREGFFVDDFTLAEVKTLRARQAFPGRDTSHDDTLEIPTLEEILALVKRLEASTGRRIGLYPETKHPSYFASRGLALEPPLVASLRAHGYERASDPVFLQSFEPTSLEALAQATGLRRVLLVAYDAAPDLDLAARVAHGVGVHKQHVLPRDAAGRYLPPTDLVERAHARGLFVHVYTFRDEASTLSTDDDGDPARELRRFYDLGVDGVFADFPDTAVRARRSPD